VLERSDRPERREAVRPAELGRRDFLGLLAAGVATGVACRPSPDAAALDPLSPEAARMLNGKICLVTGATSGLGAVTSLELARRGATVIVAGRSADRCGAQADLIRRATGARAEIAVADLASLAEVRRLASEVAGRFERLDVLVNNAGTYRFERAVTVDGLEHTFAVNYLAHFLLTNLLLDRLRASPAARIVSLSSVAHRDGKIEWDNLQGERSYERLDAYARSKLAILAFTYELARRLAGSGITANAVHPGIVATKLGSEGDLVRGWLRVRVRNFVKRGSMLTPEQGARAVVHAATAPELAGVTGRYLDQGRDVKSSPASYDEAVAARLWTVSEELTGLRPRL
jgi:NAD(P)-dependent dehydrogenase (short-subunit alcohol dehydrogenase family)